jgi:coenzyme F420-reducing hydrogenase alpha subunit
MDEAEKFSNCSDGISYICPLCSNEKGNMEKKYNTQNETSHTPNSDMAFDYSGDDMEQTKNLSDSNSDDSSMMSEEFPLHKIETFIKEQSYSNSYMKKYNTDQKHTVINNNISEEPLPFAVENVDNVGENVYDYDNNNNHSEKVRCVSNNFYEEDVTHRVSKR